MPFWTFYEYIDDDQANQMSAWYGMISAQILADFEIFIRTLAETEDWDEPKKRDRKYEELTKKHVGLTELILKSDSFRIRIVGLWQRQERKFVMFTGCKKFTWRTDPPGAFNRALYLKQQYEAGRGTIREYI